jgi:nucleoside-diphosphate-sugar epimerase
MSVTPPGRVVLVGASGYLAGAVAGRLRAAGYTLRGFDRVAPPDDRGFAEFVEGDITRPDDVRRAVEGQEGVVQLVALVRGPPDRPRERWQHTPLERYVDVMVKGTWLVVDAAASAGARRMVNVSSVSAIGRPPIGDEALRESHPPAFVEHAPHMYCRIAKWLGEEIARAYHQAHAVAGDFSVVNIRPGVVAGDGINPGPPTTRPASTPCSAWRARSRPRSAAPAYASRR